MKCAGCAACYHVTVLNNTGLPTGEYVFYFAVDARDGWLDISQAWIDSVRVSIR